MKLSFIFVILSLYVVVVDAWWAAFGRPFMWSLNIGMTALYLKDPIMNYDWKGLIFKKEYADFTE